jgi:hypothetical protein
MEMLTILASSGSSTYLEAPVNLVFIHHSLSFSGAKDPCVARTIFSILPAQPEKFNYNFTVRTPFWALDRKDPSIPLASRPQCRLGQEHSNFHQTASAGNQEFRK